MKNDQVSSDIESLDDSLNSNPGLFVLETNNDDGLCNHTARAKAIIAASRVPPNAPTTFLATSSVPRTAQTTLLHVASIVSSDEWARSIQEIASKDNYAKTSHKSYDKIWIALTASSGLLKSESTSMIDRVGNILANLRKQTFLISKHVLLLGLCPSERRD